MQTDNGLEFKNKLFVEMIASWPGECEIIYGRPRHPQSQGKVEQANGTVEALLTAAMAQFKTKEWSKLLPLVQYTMNTNRSSQSKFMPYEILFNKKPNEGTIKQFYNMDLHGNVK